MNIPDQSFFTLQWHITARCELNCRHCYVKRADTFSDEIKKELGFEDCLEVIDDFVKTLAHWDISGGIMLTGGDPLLHPTIFDILEYCQSKDVVVGLMGNSTFLTEEVAIKLKDLGISCYQMSIDGLENTHDYWRRKKGQFRDTLRAISILNSVGIPSLIQFTVTKSNAKELIDVIRLLVKKNVSEFGFSRVVPTCDNQLLQPEMLTPREYRALLLEVLEEYRVLREQGYKTYFGKQESLWALLDDEIGLLRRELDDQFKIVSGCSASHGGLAILADGTVYPCRRLPIKIGQVPNQSLKEIFEKSPILNTLRNTSEMKKCRECGLRLFCRGCLAVAYAVSGDFLSADPQCWKKIEMNTRCSLS